MECGVGGKFGELDNWRHGNGTERTWRDCVTVSAGCGMWGDREQKNRAEKEDKPIGDDAQTVYTIPSHKTLEALLIPHSDQTGPYAAVLATRALRLNLSATSHEIRIKQEE